MKRIALVLAVLLPAATFAAAPGPGMGRAGTPDPEIQKLHKEIAAAKLDRTLNLTKDQARTLLPLLKEAAALREQIKGQREARRADVIRALTAVRDDIQKTGVASEASQRALDEARNGKVKELREKKRAINQKIREVLTPEQREKLQEFNPRPVERAGKGGFGGRDEDAGGKPGRKALRVAASPEFLTLLEARAR